MRGWALGDVPQADAVSPCFLEGLPQAPEDVRVVLGRGEVAGVDSQGVERIGQHGFPCGLRHPPPRRPEAAVLHRPLAGPMDQALEGGLSPGPLPQLPELRVGPALPPLFLGGPAVLGGGVGVGGCDGVVGAGGGGGPGGFLVVLFRGGAWGVGVHADVDPRVCAYGLRLGVGRGFVAAAVVGHALHVGCHRGPVGGRGRCWWTLERSVGPGCGLWEVVGRGAPRFGRGALHHEGGGGGVGDGGGAPRWALLPSGLGRLGPDVVEDILGGRARAAVVAPGLGLGLGLAAGRPLAAALGFGWVLGMGFAGEWALAAVGLLAVGAGLEARLGGVPRGLGGGVLDEDVVVVVVDEVFVAVEVVESEAEERAAGDGGGSRASGAGV